MLSRFIKQKNLLDIAKNIIIFFPVILIFGPFFSEFFMFVLIFIFFNLLNKENFKNLFYGYEFKIFTIFWLVICTSSAISLSLFSFLKALAYLRFGIFFLAIKFFLDRRADIPKKLFIVLSVIFVFLFFDTLYQFFYKINFFGFQAIDYPRLSSIFNEEYILGSYVVRMIPIFLALCFCNLDIKYKKITTTLIFFLAALVVLMSGERVAVLYLGIVLLLLILFLIKINFKYALSIIIFFLLLSSTIILNDNLNKRYIKQTIDEFGFTTNKIYQKEYATSKPIYKNIYIFSPAHQSYYLTAFNMFLNKPIFGHGLKSFRTKCSNIKFQDNVNSCSTHPHNIYFELLSESGIAGFLIVILTFFYFCKKSFQILKMHNLKDCNIFVYFLSIFFIFTLWPISPTGSFFNNWLSIIFFYYFGFYKYKS